MYPYPWMDLPRVIVLDLAGQLESNVVLVSWRLGELSRPGDSTPSSQLLMLMLLLLLLLKKSPSQCRSQCESVVGPRSGMIVAEVIDCGVATFGGGSQV